MTVALTIIAILLPIVIVLCCCNQCFLCFDVSCGGFLIRFIGLVCFFVAGGIFLIFGW